MERVGLFIDVQNIYYTVKQQYRCHFDYNAFWKKAASGRQVSKAVAYATSKGDRKQSNFQNILKEIGFDVKLTPYLERNDGSTKGDWDVGITMDMVECASKVDTIVLASGDGDYAMVIGKLMEKHSIDIEIYGVPGLTAYSLIKSATRYFPIEDELLLPLPRSW